MSETKESQPKSGVEMAQLFKDSEAPAETDKSKASYEGGGRGGHHWARWQQWRMYRRAKVFLAVNLVLIGLTAQTFKNVYDLQDTTITDLADAARFTIQSYQYMFSIFAAITGVALAIEYLILGAVTADLAALVINLGAILLGFAGKYLALGVDPATSSGVTRTQAAFAVIVGCADIGYGLQLLGSTTRFNWWAVTEKDAYHKAKHWWFFSIVLISGVTLGLGSVVLSNGIDLGMNDQADNNIDGTIFHFAFAVSLFAIAVNLAVAHAMWYTGVYSKGFLALAISFGILTLGFSSSMIQEDTASGSFSDVCVAWQSFNIILGAVTFLLGLAVAKLAPKEEGSIASQEGKGKYWLYVVISLVLVFYALTAVVFDKKYVGETLPAGQWGNSQSAMAYLTAFFASCFFISRDYAQLTANNTSGINALALVWGATLLGFISDFVHTFVSPLNTEVGAHPTLKAWEGVGLCVAAISFVSGLMRIRRKSGSCDPKTGACDPTTTNKAGCENC